MKIYVACALTDMPKIYVRSVKKLILVLEKRGYEILKWVVALDDHWGSTQVFGHDIKCVRQADLLVALCDNRSTGMGIELGTSFFDCPGKPVLCLAGESVNVTPMVLGAAKVLPQVEFRRYRDLLADVPNLVDEFIRQKFPQPLFELMQVVV